VISARPARPGSNAARSRIAIHCEGSPDAAFCAPQDGTCRTKEEVSMRGLIAGAVALLALSGAALAQDASSGIKRTPLQALDFPDGYKTVIGIAEVSPGVQSGAHSHPGIETGYILEGESILAIDGQPEITLKAGDSYAIPANAVHNVRAVGDKPTKVIATYVVERDKPLATPAK
jgi:quercetin dioxygenase-like cupin family protein